MRTPLFQVGDLLKDNVRNVILVVLSAYDSTSDLKYTVAFVNIPDNYISTTDFYINTIEYVFLKL
jgi:hypothetical protein